MKESCQFLVSENTLIPSSPKMNRIEKLQSKKKITIITCYDASFAGWLEKNKCDALLVGDSLGIYVKGEISTKTVLLDELLYHTKAVKSGAKSIPIISDMPYGTFNTKRMALQNASKIIDAGADMVKIEGDIEIYPIIDHLTEHGIRVCGHIGFTPQTIDKPKKHYDPKVFLAKAKSIEACGASMIVLSMMGERVDALITKNLNIPTISFRSSDSCDGCVEILHDLLGISSNSYVFKRNGIKKHNDSSEALVQKFLKKV